MTDRGDVNRTRYQKQELIEATARRRAHIKARIANDIVLREAMVEMLAREFLQRHGFAGTLESLDMEMKGNALRERKAAAKAGKDPGQRAIASEVYEKARFRGSDLVREHCAHEKGIKEDAVARKLLAKQQPTSLEVLLHSMVATAQTLRSAQRPRSASEQEATGGSRAVISAKGLRKPKPKPKRPSSSIGFDADHESHLFENRHMYSTIPLPQRSVAATASSMFGTPSALTFGTSALSKPGAALGSTGTSPKGVQVEESVMEILRNSMRQADRTPTEATLFQEKRTTARMLRQLDQDAATVSFEADAGDAVSRAKLEYAALQSDLNELSDFPVKERMTMLRREVLLHAENDTRRRASEKRIQLEQKRNAAEARRELKGSFREPHNLRPCACCSHPFEACKLTVQVQNHAIILKKRSWDPAVKIDPRDEAAARMYDLKRICVFCAQFFESTGDDLRRTTSLPIATEREKQDAASSQKAGAFVSRRGSVVIAGGDVGRSPAPRTRHTARKKLPQP
jgi:hypothetical protein